MGEGFSTQPAEGGGFSFLPQFLPFQSWALREDHISGAEYAQTLPPQMGPLASPGSTRWLGIRAELLPEWLKLCYFLHLLTVPAPRGTLGPSRQYARVRPVLLPRPTLTVHSKPEGSPLKTQQAPGSFSHLSEVRGQPLQFTESEMHTIPLLKSGHSQQFSYVGEQAPSFLSST